MNILTHPVHTGYQFDLSKTGHEFFSLDIPGSGEVFWDSKSRPQPRNFHRLKSLDDAPVKFDLALVHFDLGYYYLGHLDLPLIFKEHCLRSPFGVPDEWSQRITCYSFASQTAASRWILPPELAPRKAIIGMGMDLRSYGRYQGGSGRVLVVGQNIHGRGNVKGRDNLLQIAEKVPFTVVGYGSQKLPGGVGVAANYAELLGHYRKHSAFLNPARTLGMSTLEAMATGMPVVTFRTVNSDIIRNGVNGFVVETVDEARRALKRLLSDRRLALRLGRNARETIRERFSAAKFVERWNSLFRQAVFDHRPGTKFKLWEPFDLSKKTPGERRAARPLLKLPFEYRRVGYDQRRMTFLANGQVGDGAARCERFWDIKADRSEGISLEISSGLELTCRLTPQPDGTWQGKWLHHERMPVILSPLNANGDKSNTLSKKIGAAARNPRAAALPPVFSQPPPTQKSRRHSPDGRPFSLLRVKERESFKNLFASHIFSRAIFRKKLERSARVAPYYWQANDQNRAHWRRKRRQPHHSNPAIAFKPAEKLE